MLFVSKKKKKQELKDGQLQFQLCPVDVAMYLLWTINAAWGHKCSSAGLEILGLMWGKKKTKHKNHIYLTK